MACPPFCGRGGQWDPNNIRSKYWIKRKLGTGAFGQVRAAIEKETGGRRAVKMILKNEAQHHELVNEVEIMQQLDHPNIVKLFDFFEDKNFYYYVMELCEGGALLAKLEDEIFLTEETASKYVRQILSALEYMHAKNIIHRDIKPENIMFAKKERGKEALLKLVDFGLATQLPEGKTTIKDDPCGTVYYLPPEACRGIHTVKADIWAVGVIVYMVLFGMAPFDGSDAKEVMAHDFMRKCLEKDPNKRFTATQALEHPWIVKAGSERLDKKKISDVRSVLDLHRQSVSRRQEIDTIVRQRIKDENRGHREKRRESRRMSMVSGSQSSKRQSHHQLRYGDPRRSVSSPGSQRVRHSISEKVAHAIEKFVLPNRILSRTDTHRSSLSGSVISYKSSNDKSNVDKRNSRRNSQIIIPLQYLEDSKTFVQLDNLPSFDESSHTDDDNNTRRNSTLSQHTAPAVAMIVNGTDNDVDKQQKTENEKRKEGDVVDGAVVEAVAGAGVVGVKPPKADDKDKEMAEAALDDALNQLSLSVLKK
ncbi:unnamed protein product [Vitrella brassicaformis CCMP3155]|uniref:non-specific serine/threonine protein kinase n=1 Tax=Vitrella brassicaformis (strain CCMP3155) TaxID=1169540 RepID=A0A0G4F7Y5_VITBC|nr:unnamed protein product [Vitrella brassicaformis CCMP3155]|eukprot:CEM08786.1 unnamed protein product [Vitrella brassicaformis CCMP3155]